MLADCDLDLGDATDSHSSREFAGALLRVLGSTAVSSPTRDLTCAVDRSVELFQHFATGLQGSA